MPGTAYAGSAEMPAGKKMLLELGGGLERKRVGCHGPSVLAVGRQLALVLGVAVCLASAIKLAILLECSGLKNPVVHVLRSAAACTRIETLAGRWSAAWQAHRLNTGRSP
eukprot:354157-Chlamydomonas_euryale.AAC.7